MQPLTPEDIEPAECANRDAIVMVLPKVTNGIEVVFSGIVSQSPWGLLRMRILVETKSHFGRLGISKILTTSRG